MKNEYDLENMKSEKNPYTDLLEKLNVLEDGLKKIRDKEIAVSNTIKMWLDNDCKTPPEFDKIVDKHFWNLT